MVVALAYRLDDGELQLVDHFVLPRAGRFYFATTQPGTYALAAFQDENANLIYDPGEPGRGAEPGTTFRLRRGETRSGMTIRVGADDRIAANEAIDIRQLQARSLAAQLATTLGQLTVAGKVIELSDGRLSRSNGEKGLWRPFDFVFDVGPGIYFLQDFDPSRQPVLFVHGIGGNPQEFAYLIDRLDRGRFQPWVYFYPSGSRLEDIAEHLNQVVSRLHVEHGFEELTVVAHSMGGLVARAFLLRHSETTGGGLVRRLVTLSTPWGGHDSARLGVEYAPEAVYSWVDVAPESEFLRELFYRDRDARQPRRLPDGVAHHLLFGFRRRAGRPGASGDGVVSVASELRPEAQDEAASIYGFDVDHTGILRSPRVAEHLSGILAEAAP